jgi:hypothetical protein
MTELIHLGNDLGAGANKLFGPGGGCQIVSTVALDDGRTLARMPGLSRRRRPLRIQTDFGDFYVGPRAHDWGRPVENLDYERFSGTPEMVALSYGGFTTYIKQHGPLAAPASMTAGLPLGTLSGDRNQISTTVRNLQHWLKGDHYWEANGTRYHITIQEVRVTSQPVGALFDHLLDDEGGFIPKRKALFKQEIGVVSIGMHTVELMTVRNGAPVPRFTAGRTAGVRRLLGLLNTDGHYSLGELDALLRAGQLDTSQALPIWEREVTAFIGNTWGAAAKRFAAVLVVGGGAILLRKTLLLHFDGRAVVPDDPIISIARGLYKLSLRQAQREKRKGKA